VPTATPIPRGPTVLTLYSAADLLTGPGCPVCRYAGGAADRYLAWFALEGHADVVTITRLCSSLGMCPRHTRGLMSQPGAARRLTAVYRAARDRLSGRAARLAGCPGCEHDDGLIARSDSPRLASRDGLRRRRARDAAAHGSGHSVAWLGAVRRLPGHGPVRDRFCLGKILRASDGDQPDRRLLCSGHLNDLVILAGQRNASSLLAWQAGCLAADLTRRPVPSPGAARWLPRSRRRRAGGPVSCPVCLSAGNAAQRAVDDLRASFRVAHPAPGRRAPLCVRHLLGLRALDPWAGQVTAGDAAEHANVLIAELDEAFSKNTWAHRHETRGPEMTAWRRAAAFLDGGVCCGCPPRET
jgi:hypothetical protein